MKTVVLITDGTLADEPVCSSSAEDDSDLLAEIARASDQGIKLVVLGLPGIEGEPRRLSRLVEASRADSSYVELELFSTGPGAHCTSCMIEDALMTHLVVWSHPSCDIEVERTEGEADFESGNVVFTLRDDSVLQLKDDQWEVDLRNPDLPILRLLGDACQAVGDRELRSVRARFPCAG